MRREENVAKERGRNEERGREGGKDKRGGNEIRGYGIGWERRKELRREERKGDKETG